MSSKKAFFSGRMSWMKGEEKQPQGHGRTTIQCLLAHFSISTRTRGISNRYTYLDQATKLMLLYNSYAASIE